MQEWPKQVKVYTDGASRGNPGPSAIGMVFYDSSDNILEEYGEKLGEQTNNFAEYMAVIRSLEICLKNKVDVIDFYSDSQLMVRQMTGEYKVKAPQIKELFLQAQELKRKFQTVRFYHVRREFNKEADALANQALDSF